MYPASMPVAEPLVSCATFLTDIVAPLTRGVTLEIDDIEITIPEQPRELDIEFAAEIWALEYFKRQVKTVPASRTLNEILDDLKAEAYILIDNAL